MLQHVVANGSHELFADVNAEVKLHDIKDLEILLFPIAIQFVHRSRLQKFSVSRVSSYDRSRWLFRLIYY